jgi:hypothetical protein
MDEYEIGDLVVTYILNSSSNPAKPEILQHGIIIDINVNLRDILVLDDSGYQRWWSSRRWKILSKRRR